MVMRSPREELEGIILEINTQLDDLRRGLKESLPEGLQDVFNALPQGPLSTEDYKLREFHWMANRKIDNIRRNVEQLRIRAFRSLPKL